MTAIELKMSLLQEVMSLEDEQLIKKALDSVRRLWKGHPGREAGRRLRGAYQGGDLGGAKERPARREGFA